MSTTELHLLLPGLLGPVPAQAARLPELRELPALGTLFSRGRRRTLAPGFEPALAALFGVRAEQAPVGPVSLIGAGQPAGEGFWFRAAPLHLRADRDRVMAFGGAMLPVRAAEHAALAEAFNEFFAQDGLSLHVHEGAWFLRSEQAPRLNTSPLERVLGAYLDAYLPTGEDARAWINRLNETQMLFHALALNTEREARGELPVNGLWIWGGGRQPERFAAPWDWVYADDTYARGLAGLGGAAIAPRPRGLPRAGGRQLLVLDDARRALGSGDMAQWLSALAALEAQYIAPALKALGQGEWSRLVLHTDLGTGRVYSRRDRWRLWRRRKPFGDFPQLQS
ncbi:hypothetical protein [Alkalilimnicola sp. S0819]|uniref:hypothetical protein n=1 Tax=Alkalilimnicola sp. S0819 TaxID=2613922 RepID=UPI00126242C8|nr:hypothetical protein [Alkalilimnicola sp. S0819]KAB7622654.1 hypothetical protein F3N43_12350 [Alkalilimnicola sp. S0819]MPQ17425.1 hypothetical protein [Alkalilimnicola sp. S0819]